MPIFDLLQKLWENLNLRGIIVLSLSFQVLLVILAPFRKRVTSRVIIFVTWISYLVADWAADYAFGLLVKGKNRGSQGPAADAYTDLLAFWAPFLLVHLGGPDTITAFALEDNELWRRHLLDLVFQLGAAGYVFYQSLPDNKLMVPTILIFIDGLIKYFERTRSLFKASFSNFRDSILKAPDAGPNYAKLMVEYNSKIQAGIPATLEVIQEPADIESSTVDAPVEGIGELDDIKVIKKAHHYFTTFQGLLVDLIYSFHERKESRDFFKNITSEKAFKVIEAELNFIYDAFYTKATVIHCWHGYILRAISFVSALTALALFHFSPKHHLHEYDKVITYTLLIGAVSLDTAALFMLIFSNWTVAAMRLSDEPKKNSFSKRFFLKSFHMFKCEDSIFSKCILRRGWSETVLQYNLLDQCLEKCPKWVDEVIRRLRVGKLLEYLKPVKGDSFGDALRNLIFDEVKEKAKDVNNLKDIKSMCATRGEWVLKDYSGLLPFVSIVDYGESLLLWHIATELCYNNKPSNKVSRGHQMRENSKILSDYMLYLLIKQSDMMSTVSGIGQLRYRDTCEEIKKVLKESLPSKSRNKKVEACKKLLEVPTDVKPDVKGDRSKSVLFDACILAKTLQGYEYEPRWDIMSKVWVELLAYAASHCRPYTYAQQLNLGGELVSLVWLLMFHFGLSEQFQIIVDHARAKLIIDKGARGASN